MSGTVIVTWIIGGVGLVVVALYYWRKKRDNDKAMNETVAGLTGTSDMPPLNGKGKEGGKEEKGVNVRTYDAYKRAVYCETITMAVVEKIRKKYGNLGRKWLWWGQYVYALDKDIRGNYSPKEVPETLDNPPSKVYRALVQAAVAIFYNVQPEQNFFQKYGKLVLFSGVVIFFLWTVVMK